LEHLLPVKISNSAVALMANFPHCTPDMNCVRAFFSAQGVETKKERGAGISREVDMGYELRGTSSFH
jgi:hypothetical protein